MDFTCPKCSSKAFKRNGYTRHGKQNHRCLDCGRQFSLELPEKQNTENQQVICRLLYEASNETPFVKHDP
jgi:transposase-like protein